MPVRKTRGSSNRVAGAARPVREHRSPPACPGCLAGGVQHQPAGTSLWRWPSPPPGSSRPHRRCRYGCQPGGPNSAGRGGARTGCQRRRGSYPIARGAGGRPDCSAIGELADRRPATLARSGAGRTRGHDLGGRDNSARPAGRRPAQDLAIPAWHYRAGPHGRRRRPACRSAPLPIGTGTAIEAERMVNAAGLVSLAGDQVNVGFELAGQRVTLRMEGTQMAVISHDGRSPAHQALPRQPWRPAPATRCPPHGRHASTLHRAGRGAAPCVPAPGRW